jgi:Uma2 family endonuclease
MTPTTTGPVATKRMTADEFWDFCQLPENRNRDFELIRGEVVEVPRPTKRHGVVALEVGHRLRVYAERVGRGYITSNDSGVLLEEDPDTVVGPDVAYYLDATTFDELHPKWGENVPLLAVEVLSPNDKPMRVNAKVADYLANGVKVVWLVDFEERKVSVHRPARAVEFFGAGDVLIGGDELPGFEVPVADLFKLPGQPNAAPPQGPS